MRKELGVDTLTTTTLRESLGARLLGMMKDETAGDEILGFVGLRVKLYAYKTHKEEEKKRKGIKSR